MKVIYAQEPLKKLYSNSIFLAGPTPRAEDVKSWRPEALKLFQDKQFKGTIFVPEARDGIWKNNYISGIHSLDFSTHPFISLPEVAK